MNNKRLFYIIFAFFVLHFGLASAGLKIDIAAEGESALATISTVKTNALDKVNAAAKKFQESKIGQKLIVTYEKAQAELGKLKNDIKAGKEMYDEAKKTYDKGKEVYDIGKSTYEEGMEQLESTQAVSTLTLEKERAQINEDINARKNVLKEELSARVQNAAENEKIYQALAEFASTEEEKALVDEKIKEVQEQKSTYEQNLADILGGNDDYFESDEEYKNLNQKLEETNQKLEEAKAALVVAAGGIAAMAVGKLISYTKEQKKKMYDEAQDANFVSADKALDDKSAKNINKNRREVFKDDIVSAFVAIANTRIKTNEVEEKNDDTKFNIKEADVAVDTRRAITNDQPVMIFERMADDFVIESAILKLESSETLLHQGYRQNNPNKNSAQIDLDQYETTKSDLEQGGRKGE